MSASQTEPAVRLAQDAGATGVVVRPLVAEDVAAAEEAMTAAFFALDEALGDPVPERTPEGVAYAQWRIRHLQGTDPDGAWAAEGPSGVVGVALALRRASLWGLSLLAVHPQAQSRGVGHRLLDAALSTADAAGTAVIIASADARAQRRYALAGFDLHPQVRLVGKVSRGGLAATTGVRLGGPEDLELTAAVDTALRGADHLPDWAELLRLGYAQLLVGEDGPDRGYALVTPKRVLCVAATAPDLGARLLTEALAGIEPDQDVQVNFISAGQDWAIATGLQAGLAIGAEGAVFWRGRTPPAPYLPSGAFL